VAYAALGRLPEPAGLLNVLVSAEALTEKNHQYGAED